MQLGTILDPIADKLMLVTAFIVLSMRSIFPPPVPSHLPVPFWVTVAVISRDVFIIVGAAAINIVTGFRGFRPSLLGKINTTVQIVAIGIIMLAASVPYGTGYYLPTLYVTVFAFAVLSGAHYVFFVSRLLNEDRRNQKLTVTHSGIILSSRSTMVSDKLQLVDVLGKIQIRRSKTRKRDSTTS